VSAVGKLLVELTRADVPQLVKDAYGGLKRFFAAQPRLFTLEGDESAVTVALAPGAREALLARLAAGVGPTG
jgi:hypothetical protein